MRNFAFVKKNAGVLSGMFLMATKMNDDTIKSSLGSSGLFTPPPVLTRAMTHIRDKGEPCMWVEKGQPWALVFYRNEPNAEHYFKVMLDKIFDVNGLTKTPERMDAYHKVVAELMEDYKSKASFWGQLKMHFGAA